MRDERRAASVLEALRNAFVAPAVAPPVVEVAPPAIVVLCRADDVWAAGGAVALAAGEGVVAAYGDGIAAPLGRLPATRGAGRIAAMLRSRGHDASASGRVVRVVLGELGEAGRVAAAAGVAFVTVLAGPRDETVDAFLRGQDRILVQADDAIADLALASLTALDVPARRLHLVGSPAARALAAAGAALLPPLRTHVQEALA